MSRDWNTIIRPIVRCLPWTRWRTAHAAQAPIHDHLIHLAHWRVCDFCQRSRLILWGSLRLCLRRQITRRGEPPSISRGDAGVIETGKPRPARPTSYPSSCSLLSLIRCYAEVATSVTSYLRSSAVSPRQKLGSGRRSWTAKWPSTTTIPCTLWLELQTGNYRNKVFSRVYRCYLIIAFASRHNMSLKNTLDVDRKGRRLAVDPHVTWGVNVEYN